MLKTSHNAILIFLIIVFIFSIKGDCQDSADSGKINSGNDGFFLGMPTVVATTLMVIIVGVVSSLLTYFFVHRKRQRVDDRKLTLDEKRFERDYRRDALSEQEYIERREEKLKEEKEKVRHYKTFEEKYLGYLFQHHRHLKIQGLKTKVPVSVDLKKVYVPLKAYKPAARLRKYVGEKEMGDYIKPGWVKIDENHPQYEEIEREREEQVNISSILKAKKRIAVLGGPGCGKTTFLGYLALAFSQNLQKEWLGVGDYKIPICIACRDLNPEKLPSSSDIHNWCLPEVMKGENPDDFFTKNLDAGNCVILLDGLDEVATLANRQAIIEWIRDLADAHDKNQFIVTSRIMGYEQARLEAGFAEYFVSDFDDSDIEKFIKYWYLTIETTLKDDTGYAREEAENAAKELTPAVLSNDRIKRLAGIPLLLSIIATVHRYSGRLPDNRVKLYDECIDLLLGGKDEAIKFPLMLSSAKKLEVLKPLANYMHLRKIREIRRDELADQVGRYLPNVAGSEVNVDNFIEEVRNRSGLLVERGQDLFGFSHLTFQEYLTALYLKDQPNVVDALIDHKDDSWWRETTLLYCGMTNGTDLAKRLLECREDVLLSNFRFAALCMNESLSFDPALRQLIADKLFDYYWAVPIREIEIMMFDILSVAKDDRIFIRLAEVAKSNDNNIRRRAIDVLGEIGGEKAIEILHTILNDNDKRIRGSVAKALGRSGSEKAQDALYTLLDDESNFVRGRAADAIGQLGGKTAFPILLNLLNRGNTAIRVRAISAIGRLGGDVALESLSGLLKDKNRNIRLRVASALGRMNNVKTLESLLSLLSDDDRNVRLQAASALGRLGENEALEPLMEIVGDEDRNVRIQAAIALGQIGNEKAFESLLRLLGDGDRNVRAYAAYALGQIGTERAIGPLLEILSDNDMFTRTRAASALGRLGNEKALVPLLGLLSDKDIGVRQSAAFALGKLGCKDALEPLLKHLDDENIYVRANAAGAISKIATTEKPPLPIEKIDCRDVAGKYLYFKALYGYLQNNKVYIDDLPDEVIERNWFWKDRLKPV